MTHQPPLTRQIHDHLRSFLRPGAFVVDCTAGNGHDTLALSNLVGPEGRVWALDCQSRAIHHSCNRLYLHGKRNVTFVCANHACLLNILPSSLHRRIFCAVFNLGYLPGSDRSIITAGSSTVDALQALLKVLQPGGQIVVTAYTGHAGGMEEATAVWSFFHQCAANNEQHLVRLDPLAPPKPAVAILQHGSSSGTSS